MGKNWKFMEQPDIYEFIEMIDNSEVAGMRERCTKENLSKSILKFKKMSIASVELWDNGCYFEEDGPVIDKMPAFYKVIVHSEIGGGHIANIDVVLPLVWNGRLIGTTGGGSASKLHYSQLYEGGLNNSWIVAVKNHFAAVVTDNSVNMGEWGFRKDSDELDWDQFMAWAYLGTHDMTLVAKTISEYAYGKAPEYCYLAGGSGGGRQVMKYLQLYPKEYDAVLANYPAVPWVPLHITEAWPFIVMNNMKHNIKAEKFEALFQAVLKKYGCTEVGYVNNCYFPEYDLDNLLGVETPAGRITEDDIAVMKRIYDGPTYADGRKMEKCEGWSVGIRIWKDICSQLLLNEEGEVDPAGANPIARQVFGWVMRNPDFKMEDITFELVDELYDRGKAEFAFTDGQNVDLREFRDAGAKLICTMSSGDGAVPAKTAYKYYKDVVKFFGSEAEVNQFYKFYMTYGGPHGVMMDGVYGEQMSISDSWIALMRWTEEVIEPGEIATLTWDSEKKKAVRISTAKPYLLSEEMN